MAVAYDIWVPVVYSYVDSAAVLRPRVRRELRGPSSKIKTNPQRLSTNQTCFI